MGNEARLNPMSRAFSGSSTVIDARGRTLQEGDEIILAIPGPLYFRVAQITPVVDPTAPPGLLQVHVGCMLTFGAKRGAVNREFVRVRTAEEAGPSTFKLIEAQEQKAAQEQAGPTLVKPQGDGDDGSER